MSNVTAFLGPNSSGKTTALFAIRLACQALELSNNEDATPRFQNKSFVMTGTLANDGLLVGDHTKLIPLADWEALFVNHAVGEGTSLRILVGFEEHDPIQSLDVQLVCARNNQLKLKVSFDSTKLELEMSNLGRPATKKLTLLVRKFLETHQPRAVFIPPFYGTVREEEHRSKVVIDRLLGSGDQSHAVRNLVAGLSASQFDQLNAFLTELKVGKLIYRTSGDSLQTEFPLRVMFQDSNGELEISAAGAGFVNMVALFSSLSRSQDESKDRTLIFLLDEPEAHLHPRLQADSAERIAKLVNKEFGAQLIIATHSVEILNRLFIVGASLIRTDRDLEEGSTLLAANDALFSDIQSWADLTPYTAINFLASRRIVFCEGTSDKIIIETLAKLRFRNNPKQMELFKRWTILPLGSSSKRPEAELLVRILRNDLIVAKANEAVFHVAIVLDRDFEREPKQETNPIEKTPVSKTEVVWSKHSIESLFLTPELLYVWVENSLGHAPPKLREWIAQAIGAADEDKDLNQYAVGELLTSNFKKAESKNDANMKSSFHKAGDLVSRDPATWQRGKDRSRHILGTIRRQLNHEQARQFKTTLADFVAASPIDGFGDPSKAIPTEVNGLFDLLVKPD
jgi:hypothetical protein